MKYFEEGINADQSVKLFYFQTFDTLLLLVPIVYYFQRLFKIMKKKHNYEYLKAYKSMTIYFGGLIFAEFVCFSMCCLKFKLWSKFDNRIPELSFEDICEKNTKLIVNLIFFADIILLRMWIIQYLSLFAIIILKSSDDILSGLNKLESIVTLSNFQIFKEPPSRSYSDS
jgi:hypothetical protein